MLNNIIDAVREENAQFVRETEYVKETAIDDVVDFRTESAEAEIMMDETDEEIMEAVQFTERLSGEEDPEEAKAEVGRLLNATENVTFNEMIGV